MRGKAKGRAIVNAQKKAKTTFPEFNVLDYDNSIKENLAHYRANFDSKEMKEFALSYWKSQNVDVTGLSKLAHGYYDPLGAICHIATRGNNLSDHHIQFIETKRRELLEIAKKQQVEVVEKPVVDKSIQIEKETDFHIAEFEFMLEEFMQGKKLDPQKYLVGAQVKKPVMSNISNHFSKKMEELNEIDNDEQLQEGYSNFSKKEMREFKEYIQSIINACGVSSSIIKARKPRTKKVKSPALLVRNVKYMKEFADLKLKSVSPEKIIDSKEVWIFNTKLRKIFKYISLEGLTLTVKGTTIIGYDPEKSGSKILRKPDLQLKEIESMTSRPLNKLYNEIKATVSKATGRINEDSIILKCF